MRALRKDHSGEKHGRLLLLGRAPSHLYGRTNYFCRCDCGREVSVLWQSIKRGTTVSCGCYLLSILRTKGRNARHGLSNSRAHKAWCAMKKRCLNRNDHAYMRYGGRGITICARWLNSFENFYADMGQCPDDLELERVDVNGHYEPGNCRWATIAEQANNKRNTRRVLVNGVAMGLLEAARVTGRKYATVYYHAVRSGTLP